MGRKVRGVQEGGILAFRGHNSSPTLLRNINAISRFSERIRVIPILQDTGFGIWGERFFTDFPIPARISLQGNVGGRKPLPLRSIPQARISRNHGNLAVKR
jgi:hypothetical protein